ncbi:conserved hypothetical protein [Perkinsus marinus ATCC 50983]|uniref:Aminotransferase class V domain-containing protein n=1 Tax=Perkinsus marinus (strain ATCC 50983 / TXsc) TaxID=423536 RepID=C5LTU0_PERM5|nr:conserved hypothetical protein [Perkinsus marinus ATCC 50983]EEQ99902.1 conserved hypothetical protein [Perkinsus marinus ATCC 50983]|eukprot:XP_002767185.1 conserved hypothetical protein [Perkinsus marinus ATCC 50983]
MGRCSVIFCGAGATGAITKFVDIMCRSRVFATPTSRKGRRRATLPLDSIKGTASINGLEEVLKKVAAFNRHHHDFTVPVVILSACSNVTGARLDIPAVSTLIHQYNGLAAWDLAAIAAHNKVDMNSPSHPNGYMDFAFVSPHKLLGGPGSSGLLLCKKKHQTNAVPAVCGGGVVLYVSRRGHHYLGNLEEREEAGTPDILGCIRTGAIYHLHRMVGIERIASSEQRMADYLAHRIRAHSKVHVVGPKDRSHCAGIISFNVLYNETDTATKHGLYLHYNFVGAVLNDVFGIQARGGCACAGPYGEALLGLNCGSAERFEEALDDTRYEIFKPGFVRVGVHFTMTQEEVDFVADAILWIADNGWKLLPSYTYKIMSGEWYHIKRDSHQMLK